jgi:hypothetical protein
LRTGRTGAAAKAGHDLLIHVTSWEATLEIGGDHALTGVRLEGDGASLRVQEGTGGMKALSDGDKAEIARTIDEEILKGQAIAFRSTAVRPLADAGGFAVEGDLTLAGATRPIAFDLAVGDDGGLSAALVIVQTDWGITPYSTLFGALKVADEVEVRVDARVQSV